MDMRTDIAAIEMVHPSDTCAFCFGTGYCVDGNRLKACPKCRRAHLLASFGEAVMWVLVDRDDGDTWYPAETDYFRPWVTTARPTKETIHNDLVPSSFFLGGDCQSNMVELIDHEGETFNIREWLNQFADASKKEGT